MIRPVYTGDLPTPYDPRNLADGHLVEAAEKVGRIVAAAMMGNE